MTTGPDQNLTVIRYRCCTCNGIGVDSLNNTCVDCDGSGIDSHGA
ncbi:hypothetical protein [Microtetraspora malaysiensis]|nr:hypothetical protein [Microtetraspora malaysiensis]